ncbi:MarR family transcriptional regulator [soil metagenome]
MRSSPGSLLWQVSNRWQAAQRAALEPLGLTHVRFVALASLAWLESEGPITQRRLAEHAALDVMMTSQVLRALEHDQLIERLVHPTDARARALRTTPQGRALARRAIAVVEQCDQDFFAPLGSEPDELIRALGVLADAAA